MKASLIDKRSHPTVHKLRMVRDGREPTLVFCEGPKLVDELLASSWGVNSVYVVPSKEKNVRSLLMRTKRAATPIFTLSDDVMAFCSDLDTPPGVIAVAPRPHDTCVPSEQSIPLDLVLFGVQLPQNVGALLRVAEAAGVGRVTGTENSADFYGAKALRGASGSTFRMSLRRVKTLEEALGDDRSRSTNVLAAAQNAEMPYDQWDWCRPTTLIMGSEGHGFSTVDLPKTAHTISIPMKGRVESLNVATAAAVCLFEAARQRRSAEGR